MGEAGRRQGYLGDRGPDTEAVWRWRLARGVHSVVRSSEVGENERGRGGGGGGGGVNSYGSVHQYALRNVSEMWTLFLSLSLSLSFSLSLSLSSDRCRQ